MAEAVMLKLLVVAIPARSTYGRTRYRRNSGLGISLRNNVSNGVMTVYGVMKVGPYRLYFACEQAFGRILVFKTVITPLLTLYGVR